MSTETQDELTALMLKRQAAFTFVPQLTRCEDGSWKARYPAADWSATGDTREAALARLHDAAFTRRGTQGENTWQLNAVRDHLTNGPVAGVYEIPLDVNERIMQSADPKAALDAVIKQLDGRTVGVLGGVDSDGESQQPDGAGA